MLLWLYTEVRWVGDRWWFQLFHLCLKVKLFLCMTWWHGGGGRRGIAPLIPELSTRWRLVVGFIAHPLRSKGQNTLYPLSRRLGWTPQPVWHSIEQESLLYLPEAEPCIIQPVALSLSLSVVVFACGQPRTLFISSVSHHQHSCEYSGYKTGAEYVKVHGKVNVMTSRRMGVQTGVSPFQYLCHSFFIILYCYQQMHNYFTNYHTPTCFDTIVSSSGSL